MNGTGERVGRVGRTGPRTGLVSAVALVAVALTGCGAPGAGGEGEVLVIAATAVANEPRPVLTSRGRQEVEAALATDRARLRVVLGGVERATVVRESDLRLLRGNQVEHDQGRRRELSGAEVDRIAEVIGSAASNAPGLDLLGVLDHVGRTPGRATAVVISSGLQTTGALAVPRLGWDQVGSAAVVEQAKRDRLVPDLRGKRVVFTGLGEVSSPQEALPAPLRERLVALWLGICRAGGGDCSIDTDPLVGGAPLSTEPVPTVPVPQPPPIPVGSRAPIELPSDTLFDPDSTALRPDAEALMRRVAAALGGRGANLVGHTASVGPADTARALSLRRAEAVRDALVALGVPATALTVTGVGFDQPLAPDRDGAGDLVPAAAQRNRTVSVTIR